MALVSPSTQPDPSPVSRPNPQLRSPSGIFWLRADNATTTKQWLDELRKNIATQKANKASFERPPPGPRPTSLLRSMSARVSLYVCLGAQAVYILDN
jgi:hypothetical protein